MRSARYSHKVCQVAGGHVTDPAGTAEWYSSVVSPEGVREVIFVANHNGLEVWVVTWVTLTSMARLERLFSPFLVLNTDPSLPVTL